jgi:hypothetical protein
MRGVGERVAGLAAVPVAVEPALLAQPGGHHPHRGLRHVEARHERDQRPQPHRAAAVAQVVAEQVEHERARLHRARISATTP